MAILRCFVLALVAVSGEADFLSGSERSLAGSQPCGEVAAKVCDNPHLLCYADPACMQKSLTGCRAANGFDVCRYCGLGGGTPPCPVTAPTPAPTPPPAPSPPAFTVLANRTGCSNFAKLTLFDSLKGVSNGMCADACRSIAGCLFWTYQDLPSDVCSAQGPFDVPVLQPPLAEDSCRLFGGDCAEEPNACWDVVTLSRPPPAPSPVPFAVASPKTGCKNFNKLSAFGTYIGVSNAFCAQLCSRTKECTFWTYQDVPNSDCASYPAPAQPPVGDDACILFGGACEREDNGCWDLVTLSVPSPAPLFTVVAQNMGCKNFARMRSFGIFKSVSNGQCAQICMRMPGCLFWTYQDEPNSMCFDPKAYPRPVQPPVADDSCSLFGGDCAKEVNSCWDVVTLTRPPPAPTPVPFSVVSPMTGCKNVNSLPVFGSYIGVSNGFCANVCSQTRGCSFWTYQDVPNSECAAYPAPVQPPVGDDACILFGGTCDKEDNACWDMVTVSGPAPAPLFTVIAQNTGCKNFKTLRFFGFLRGASNAVCAQACARTPGCLMWTYQDEPTSMCFNPKAYPRPVQPPLADDSCKLFGGVCAREANACWDLVTLSVPAPAPFPTPFSVISPATGCKNFKSLTALGSYIGVSNVVCARICWETRGCSFWTYQDLPNSDCARSRYPAPVQPPVGDDSCILFGGTCDREANACWDLVTLSPPPCSSRPAKVCEIPSLFCYADPACLLSNQIGCNASGFQICRYCGDPRGRIAACPAY